MACLRQNSAFTASVVSREVTGDSDHRQHCDQSSLLNEMTRSQAQQPGPQLPLYIFVIPQSPRGLMLHVLLRNRADNSDHVFKHSFHLGSRRAKICINLAMQQKCTETLSPTCYTP